VVAVEVVDGVAPIAEVLLGDLVHPAKVTTGALAPIKTVLLVLVPEAEEALAQPAVQDLTLLPSAAQAA
jgi:hypothetical protein